MALIIRHRASGYQRRVHSLNVIHPALRGQWDVAKAVRSTPEEVFEWHGTGLPAEMRAPRPDRRTHG